MALKPQGQTHLLTQPLLLVVVEVVLERTMAVVVVQAAVVLVLQEQLAVQEIHHLLHLPKATMVG